MTQAAGTPLRRGRYLTVGIAGALSLAFAVVVYLATGPTLGLFFGGLLVVTLLLPPMVLCERSLARQGLVASAVNDAVGLVWLGAVIRSETTVSQWVQCYLLLAAFSFALWGLARCLSAIRFPAVPAAAITVVVAMLWLAWPVWLARALDDRAVAWLTPAHPPLAINGVVTHLGVWTEHAIAYRQLTSLGQDVAYQLPDSILAGVFAHLIVGGVLMGVASLRAEVDGDGT